MENRIFGLETEYGCLAPEQDGFVSPDVISVRAKDHIFHAERHTDASNFRVETNIRCFVPILIE